MNFGNGYVITFHGYMWEVILNRFIISTVVRVVQLISPWFNKTAVEVSLLVMNYLPRFMWICLLNHALFHHWLKQSLSVNRVDATCKLAYSECKLPNCCISLLGVQLALCRFMMLWQPEKALHLVFIVQDIFRSILINRYIYIYIYTRWTIYVLGCVTYKSSWSFSFCVVAQLL